MHRRHWVWESVVLPPWRNERERSLAARHVIGAARLLLLLLLHCVIGVRRVLCVNIRKKSALAPAAQVDNISLQNDFFDMAATYQGENDRVFAQPREQRRGLEQRP